MTDKSKSVLTYDISRGGQVIEKLDLTFVNHNRKSKLYSYATTKIDELRKEYEDTLSLWEWNEYVDSFYIGFEPVIGQTYYLYEGVTRFISILSPTEFRRRAIGATKLCVDGYWIQISI